MLLEIGHRNQCKLYSYYNSTQCKHAMEYNSKENCEKVEEGRKVTSELNISPMLISVNSSVLILN